VRQSYKLVAPPSRR